MESLNTLENMIRICKILDKVITTAMVLTVVCFILAIGMNMERCSNRNSPANAVVTDTIVVVDTVCIVQPVVKDSVVVRTIIERLPIVHADTILTDMCDSTNVSPKDSALVMLDITQQHYKGDTYEAWVSGYKPRLDSIRTFQLTRTIQTNTDNPPNRFTVGLTGGVGYGFVSKKIEPFIGIGITYRIISF